MSDLSHGQVQLKIFDGPDFGLYTRGFQDRFQKVSTRISSDHEIDKVEYKSRLHIIPSI